MRDKSLIDEYQYYFYGRPADVFDLRLTRPELDNGEYLSQGRVSIADRSCVVTLAKLEQSGLYELYPELADREGKKR